jgi:hypothetical protein
MNQYMNQCPKDMNQKDMNQCPKDIGSGGRILAQEDMNQKDMS